jgi:hypothetical protein
MKQKLIICGLLMTGVILFATACKTDTGAYVPVNTTVNDLENHAAFVLMDEHMQDSVTCSGIQQRTLSDGRLEVTANIRNRTDHQIRVQVDCVFKDAQGFPTEGDQSPFQSLILTENGQEAAHFISFNDKAVHYTIRVRKAR